jgi:hypothetical protein
MQKESKLLRPIKLLHYVTFSGEKVTKTFLKELRPKPFTLRIRLRSRAWSWEPARQYLTVEQHLFW